MATETRHERVLWDGMVCTIVAQRGRSFDLRTPTGFVWERIPKREVERLRDDDERKYFTVRSD